jgi:hypothetical protein
MAALGKDVNITFDLLVSTTVHTPARVFRQPSSPPLSSNVVIANNLPRGVSELRQRPDTARQSCQTHFRAATLTAVLTPRLSLISKSHEKAIFL